MTIHIENLSKRYDTQWIIRKANYTFEGPAVIAIQGANGSGKSTLLKLISGYLSKTAGTIRYTQDAETISREDIYKYISYAAPYTDLIEEYSLQEFLEFNVKFKPLRAGMTIDEVIELSGLSKHRNKSLGSYSSGMMQRIKNLVALTSDSEVVLLDEPTSYLDVDAKAWFSEVLKDYTTNRLVLMASNDPYDLDLADQVVDIESIQ